MTHPDTTGDPPDADADSGFDGSLEIDDLEVSDEDVAAAKRAVAPVADDPVEAAAAVDSRFDPTDLDDDDRPPLDVVFDVLQNDRRRFVLKALAAADDGQTTLKQLADDLAAAEDKDRNNVYSALYQSHLPKLETTGAIDYDQRSGDLERGPLYQDYLDAFRRVANPPDDTETDDKGRWEQLRSAFPIR